MTVIHAKPVVDGKFWIVEENGSKVGVLKITEQKKYIFSSKNAVTTFDTKKKIVEQFGPEFFIKKNIEKKIKTEEDNSLKFFEYNSTYLSQKII
jgi:hypothetical protein